MAWDSGPIDRKQCLALTTLTSRIIDPGLLLINSSKVHWVAPFPTESFKINSQKVKCTFYSGASFNNFSLIYCISGVFFSKVHLLTKSTRFAKSLSSDIDLDFHSLFSNKGPFFVFQIGLWIFGTYKIAWNDIKSIAGSCFWCHVEWFAESPCSYHKTLNWIYLHLS